MKQLAVADPVSTLVRSLGSVADRDSTALVDWREGSWEFFAVRDWAAELPPLVRQVAEGQCPPAWERRPCGRDFIVIAPLGQSRVRAVVRPYRRGGVIGRVVQKVYWGRHPRCFAELRCLLELAWRGIPVVPPVGAAVRWRAAWFYEAWLVTEYIEGSRSFWEWLQQNPTGEDRRSVIEALGRVLADLHRAGARHPDMNMHNVLVQWRSERPQVWIVDFDRVVLEPFPVDPRGSLQRLWRSATKLDPARRWWSTADHQQLERAVQRYFDGR